MTQNMRMPMVNHNLDHLFLLLSDRIQHANTKALYCSKPLPLHIYFETIEKKHKDDQQK